MGKTGSGKTTILETVLGLRDASMGRIVLGDLDVMGLNPAVRGVGYVPQDGALFSILIMIVLQYVRLCLTEFHGWRIGG